MIRKITAADEADFLELTGQFYASDAVLHDIPEAHRRATFRELMRSDVYAEGYLLEQERKIAGYGLLSKTFSQEAGGMVIWIEELYLLPQYRGRGLGRRFIAFVESMPGVARIRFEVEPDNDRALALYHRLGYRQLPYLQMIQE